MSKDIPNQKTLQAIRRIHKAKWQYIGYKDGINGHPKITLDDYIQLCQNQHTWIPIVSEEQIEKSYFEGKTDLFFKMVYEGWIPLSLQDNRYKMYASLKEVIDALIALSED